MAKGSTLNDSTTPFYRFYEATNGEYTLSKVSTTWEAPCYHFCGRRRYQLIASKRFDGTGRFGFTLIRERPQDTEEYDEGSEYQYFRVNDNIPAFDIEELDLGLHRRSFRTGTIIKLYSYDVHGNRNFIRQLAPTLDQFLFNPALPYIVKESRETLREDTRRVRAFELWAETQAE